jgi:hypothetical protein
VEEDVGSGSRLLFEPGPRRKDFDVPGKNKEIVQRRYAEGQPLKMKDKPVW